MLTTHNLHVTIACKKVCEALNLAIGVGECWAVLGLNGSGKTTLLHTLAGLRLPHRGDIYLVDRPLRSWSARMRARQLGILLQHQSDPFPSTVLETALLGRHPHLGRWQWEGPSDVMQAKAALTAVDLAGYEHRAVTTLSGGERRRLAIATILTQDPALLLLDEPTNHLDLYHQVEIMQLLQGLARYAGHTLFMAIHDVTVADRYCDHALILYGAGETLAGPAERVFTEENLTRLYHHPIRRVVTPEGRAWIPALSRSASN